MQDKWLEYLSTEGAVFDSGTDDSADSMQRAHVIEHFSGASLQQESKAENWVTALTNYAVISASASEAHDFLQAQFCNDLSTLGEAPAASAQLNGYCNPKGRLLALFHLLRDQQNTGYRLLTPASVADNLVKRLSMFVLRADVKIARSDDTQVLALGGSRAAGVLQGLLGQDHQLPASGSYSVVSTDELQLVALPGERWLLLVDSSAAGSAGTVEAVWKKLSTELTPVGLNRWNLAAIEQGEPVVSVQTTEKFIPQMLNLQSIEALSFKKGCYPGQEIVARMQYLGKLKRNMHRLRFSGPETSGDASPQSFQAGAGLQAGDDADVGVIVNAALDADGKQQCLAVLKNDCDMSKLSLIATDAATEQSRVVDGVPVEELSLPYTVSLPGAEEQT